MSIENPKIKGTLDYPVMSSTGHRIADDITVPGTIEFLTINFNRSTCRIRFYPDEGWEDFAPVRNHDTTFNLVWEHALKLYYQGLQP